MTVDDVMSPGIISCPPETPLRVVARMMATFNIHSVFVFEHRDEDDEDRRLWGIVSDLDLVAAGRLNVDERTAGGSAVTPIVTVPTDAPLMHAADLMAQHGVAHLAVVEPASGRPIGVISTLDIARAIAGELGVRETMASA
jgi:CBS domain-containing protein